MKIAGPFFRSDPDPGGILPNDPAPPPEPRPRPGVRRLTCEFCACECAPDGSYFQMSDRARSMRNQGEKIEKLDAQIAELKSVIAERDRVIAELKAPSSHSTPYSPY